MSNREPSVSLEDYDISFLQGDAFSPKLQPLPTAEDKSLLIPLHKLLNADDCELHRLRSKGCGEARRKSSRRPAHQSISCAYSTALGSPDAAVTSKPSLAPATMTTFFDGRRAPVPRASVVSSRHCDRRSLMLSVDDDSANNSLSTQLFGVPQATLLVATTKPLKKISVRQSDAVTDALDLMYGLQQKSTCKNTQNRWQNALEIVDD